LARRCDIVATRPQDGGGYHRRRDDAQGAPMAIVECSEHLLVLEAGGGLISFTLLLDKRSGNARIERSTLRWKRRPRELPLSDIKGFSVASYKDTASGAELRQLVLRTQTDESIALPVSEAEIEQAAAVLRDFLGLTV
jgi:hypothetical protein